MDLAKMYLVWNWSFKSRGQKSMLNFPSKSIKLKWDIFKLVCWIWLQWVEINSENVILNPSHFKNLAVNILIWYSTIKVMLIKVAMRIFTFRNFVSIPKQISVSFGFQVFFLWTGWKSWNERCLQILGLAWKYEKKFFRNLMKFSTLQIIIQSVAGPI